MRLFAVVTLTSALWLGSVRITLNDSKQKDESKVRKVEWATNR